MAELLPGVILAGGLARRMGGGDKALRDIGGVSILQRVIDRLAPQCGALALNANGDADRFDAYGLPVLADSVQDRPGPLAGVLAAMDWAAGQGSGRVVTVAADTPFFPTDLVARLAEQTGQPIAMATGSDPRRGVVRHPVFALWSVALRDDLRDALQDGVRKVVAWTDPHGVTPVHFEAAHDPFFNVNTPEDLAEADRRARA